MPRLSRKLRTTFTTDGAVVLDIERGCIFRFNATGSRILQALDGELDREGIIALLIQEFSVDAMTAASDVSNFIATLETYALFEP